MKTKENLERQFWFDGTSGGRSVSEVFSWDGLLFHPRCESFQHSWTTTARSIKRDATTWFFNLFCNSYSQSINYSSFSSYPWLWVLHFFCQRVLHSVLKYVRGCIKSQARWLLPNDSMEQWPSIWSPQSWNPCKPF